MSNISDLVPEVTFALGNRTDLETQAGKWLRDSYIELGNTIPFETLEEDDIGLVVPNMTDYPYPQQARAIKSLSILVGTAQQPIELRKKDIRYINRYPTTPAGTPSIWAPFKREVRIRVAPNTAFPLVMEYWKFPLIEATIADTVLEVPDDWLEVVKYGAIMRGWTDLQDYVKAQSIHVILYGDPDRPEHPGLIQQKLTQDQAENSISEYAVTPKVRPYTSR